MESAETLDTNPDSYGIALHIGEAAAAELRASLPAELESPDVLDGADRDHLLAILGILLHARASLTAGWNQYDGGYFGRAEVQEAVAAMDATPKAGV